METALWRKIKRRTHIWREVILPGTFIIGLVVVARLAGILQLQELTTFDDLMRLRPSNLTDRRVAIVGISEDDLKAVGGYPVPDRVLVKALRILQASQPRVIGLDILRDFSVQSNRAELAQAFKDIPNIIAVEVALNREDALNVKPPPGLPSERIGFVDFIVDPDSKLRRSILAGRTWQGEIKYSLPLRLTQAYLSDRGITLSGHSKSKIPNITLTEPLRFGSTKLPRLLSNWGGYVRADARGYQILVNFYNSWTFQAISLSDVLNRNFESSLIRDRIVIVGMTAASVKDSFNTTAVQSTISSSNVAGDRSDNLFMYGVEFHAHVTHQLLGAVLDNRPLLKVWSDFWEYLWIIFWGLLGVAISIALQSPWKTILSLGVASLALVSICYLFLVFGWWIPLVPTFFALCGSGLTTSFFNRDLRFLLEQRRLTIERTYDAVHNGPLQHLAVMLRSASTGDLSSERMYSQLQELNQELRAIYESMRQQVLTQSDGFYLQGNVIIDLQTPIADLLYQVYDRTLARNFPVFNTIRTYISPDFKPLEKCYLNLEQKRGLCLFLEESLCNVGKHAIGATILEINCTKKAGYYSLQIIDNGIGLASISKLGKQQGTKQAQELARRLSGKFQRLPHTPQGTICELTWPVSWNWLTRFR